MLQSWLMFAFGVTCEVLQVGLCICKVLWQGLLVVSLYANFIGARFVPSTNVCIFKIVFDA